MMVISDEESTSLLIGLSKYSGCRSWTRIYSLENCVMPIDGEPIECIRVYVDTSIFGDKITGYHYIYPRPDDCYDILKSFMISKNRESHLNSLGI